MRPSSTHHSTFIMADSLREMRTMILISLPYPPLPMVVGKVEGDTKILTGEDATTTSHTLIARCLDAAVERSDAADNARRKKAQQEVCFYSRA